MQGITSEDQRYAGILEFADALRISARYSTAVYCVSPYMLGMKIMSLALCCREAILEIWWNC